MAGDGAEVIHRGDCIEWLASLPAESVDAIVTDPPYGLGFMGKAWDALPPGKEWAEACFRVLKPGGHLIAFGGTRTVHRLTCAVEDGGFEIRDSIGWVYYSGFPKSMDVSKAIDGAAGAVREVVGRKGLHGFSGTRGTPDRLRSQAGADHRTFDEADALTAPATLDAARWSGWGTALKPAIEPAVLARKPLTSTVAGNVLAHGTGALNVDACRLLPGDPAWVGPDDGEEPARWETPRGMGFSGGTDGGACAKLTSAGRWPANLYYCPKAPRAERERGTDGLPQRSGAEAVEREEGTAGKANPRAGAGRTADLVRNFHPTVKPVRLMRWLCRLVTAPGGLVVDPFLGSGTTGIAAALEGLRFAGAEREPEYFAIASARIAHATRWPTSWAETAPGAASEADDAVEQVERRGQIALFGRAS